MGEFSHFLTKVLGEEITQTKLHILWGEMDTDLTGEIDLAEFSANALSGHKATVQGGKILKDMAVDPTKGMLADHQKNKENYSGFSTSRIWDVSQRRSSRGPNRHRRSRRRTLRSPRRTPTRL